MLAVLVGLALAALAGLPVVAAAGPSPVLAESAAAGAPTTASPASSPGVSPSAAPAGSSPSPDSSGAPPGPLRWTRLRGIEGPAAREDHTWTTQGDGAAAWLFGGRDGGRVFDDLWRFDLVSGTWAPVDPQGRRPSARFGHGAAWVEGVGLVVFAGQAGADFFADLWAFDPLAGRWRELPDDGARPAPRYGSCVTLGPDGRLWISHGFTFRGRFDDTRAYDFERGRWRDETPAERRPSERCLHDCFWSADGRLVLYGGQNEAEPSLGDSWALTPGKGWDRLRDPEAAPRRLYGLTVTEGEAWVHGGAGRDGEPLADLWRIDRVTLAWRRADAAGNEPPARSAATLVTDPAAGRVLLFGGQGASARRDDLWQLAPVDP